MDDLDIKVRIGNKEKIIGHKVRMDSPEQIMQHVPGGVQCPGMVVFHFGTTKKDTFYFINNRLYFNGCAVRTKEYSFLWQVYNKAVIEEWSEEEFVTRVKRAFTKHSATPQI